MRLPCRASLTSFVSLFDAAAEEKPSTTANGRARATTLQYAAHKEGIDDFPRGIKLIRDRGGQFYSSDVVQIANADDSAPYDNTTLVTSLTPPAGPLSALLSSNRCPCAFDLLSS